MRSPNQPQNYLDHDSRVIVQNFERRAQGTMTLRAVWGDQVVTIAGASSWIVYQVLAVPSLKPLPTAMETLQLAALQLGIPTISYYNILY